MVHDGGRRGLTNYGTMAVGEGSVKNRPKSDVATWTGPYTRQPPGDLGQSVYRAPSLVKPVHLPALLKFVVPTKDAFSRQVILPAAILWESTDHKNEGVTFGLVYRVEETLIKNVF